MEGVLNGTWAGLRDRVAELEADLDASVVDPDQRRFVHSSRGAELASALVAHAMRDRSARYALYYRCHAWLLALGADPVELAAAVRAGVPLSPMQPVIRRLPVMTIAVTVGAQLPFALGVALSGRGPVVVSLGDGALSTGVSLEALNVAALRRPDLLIVVEDNERVVALPGRDILAATPMRLAEAFGLPAHRVDADAVDTVEAAAEWIAATAGHARLLQVRVSPSDPHCLAYGP